MCCKARARLVQNKSGICRLGGGWLGRVCPKSHHRGGRPLLKAATA